ncbi:MAG: signal peptidase I [Pseudomonadota bacterium]
MIFDFSAILVILTAVSGLIWAIDARFFAKNRDDEHGLPVVVDYAKSFFPIFLIVLILRSFIVEPFRIPSGSMIPTLLVGDFILVNKNSYGIRLPMINKKVIELGDPKRGDVVVFRYPEDPSTPYIKRVIGLPGDDIEYRDKKVYVNGELMSQTDPTSFIGQRSAAQHSGSLVAEEQLGEVNHQILMTPRRASQTYQGKVPPGNYFVLGDNRDNSRDSRYWGFVPDENLVGRAFMIWMNWDRGPVFGRIGTKIK